MTPRWGGVGVMVGGAVDRGWGERGGGEGGLAAMETLARSIREAI